MSLFVLGTDTDVGKTVVSALVMARYGGRHGVRYWKPVASGSVAPPDDGDHGDRETVATLVPGVARLPERYAFAEPASPHLAARLEGRRVDLAALLDGFASHGADGPMVIEGIGGVLVPLDEAGTLFVDLAARVAVPALVVARSTLGTINHTLLTLEALARRRVTVVGVVLNGPLHAENRQAIERFGGVPVIDEVTPFPALDRGAVAARAARFDPGDRLAPHLTSHP